VEDAGEDDEELRVKVVEEGDEHEEQDEEDDINYLKFYFE
jgi:hypothetical protein